MDTLEPSTESPMYPNKAVTKSNRTCIVGGRDGDVEEDGIYLTYEIQQDSRKQSSASQSSEREESRV